MVCLAAILLEAPLLANWEAKGRTVKVSINFNKTGAKLDLPVPLVQRAEALGYDAIWCSEMYGADAITPLAYLAGFTKKIRLGTSVAQLAARSPANLAMCAMTIEELAGRGRMIIGLGVSGPQI